MRSCSSGLSLLSLHLSRLCAGHGFGVGCGNRARCCGLGCLGWLEHGHWGDCNWNGGNVKINNTNNFNRNNNFNTQRQSPRRQLCSTIHNTAAMRLTETGKQRTSLVVRVRVELVAPVVPAVRVALVVSEDPVEPAVQVALVVSEDPAVQWSRWRRSMPAAPVALVGAGKTAVAPVVQEDPVVPAVQESPVARGAGNSPRWRWSWNTARWW